MFRLISAVFLAAVLGLSSGCATNRVGSTLTPGADLSKVKSIYVVLEDGDDRKIDELIAENLTKRGYKVTRGTQKTPPYEVDAVLTYADKWMWDITMYMLQLQVILRDGSMFPLSTATSLHTSLTRKSPTEMVDEVVGNVLTAK
jgi:hypothetical protein